MSSSSEDDLPPEDNTEAKPTQRLKKYEVQALAYSGEQPLPENVLLPTTRKLKSELETYERFSQQTEAGSSTTKHHDDRFQMLDQSLPYFDDFVYICPECDNHFTSPDLFIAHLETVHNIRSYKCLGCDRVYLDRLPPWLLDMAASYECTFPLKNLTKTNENVFSNDSDAWDSSSSDSYYLESDSSESDSSESDSSDSDSSDTDSPDSDSPDSDSPDSDSPDSDSPDSDSPD